MRWRRGLLAGMSVGAVMIVLPGVAAAATIAESFSPPSIPLNDTTTLTFTIDNPDGSLHRVSFDDTLPGGVQIAGTPTMTCAGRPPCARYGDGGLHA